MHAAARTTPLVVMPNPGYQVYEGAALLAGAEPYYLNTTAANGFLPELDAVPPKVVAALPAAVPVLARQPLWRGDEPCLSEARCRWPSGIDFVIASDECYADLFDDEHAPPPSLLTAAAGMGNTALRAAA